MNWLGLMLVGSKARMGPPVLAAMRWWSSRGLHAQTKRQLEAGLFLECASAWGHTLIHVFDRGFAGPPSRENLISASAEILGLADATLAL